VRVVHAPCPGRGATIRDGTERTAKHEPAEGRFSEAKEGAAAQRRRRAPV